MIRAAIKILLLFLAGLFIGLWLRNAPNNKKKPEIIVLKQATLSKLTSPWWMRKKDEKS